MTHEQVLIDKKKKEQLLKKVRKAQGYFEMEAEEGEECDDEGVDQLANRGLRKKKESGEESDDEESDLDGFI